MNTTDISVQGMTCGHCVASVTEELQEIGNVTDVTVDLNAGGVSPVTITHEGPLDEAAVRAAVDEAGYSLA
ncbi:heavy-metal-associated domain-containing protein [Kocuria sp. HSID16901]|uniref:heavy-metal-associated domain-containing protein n=1 Tax=Kocuria sp. HSID16901 TaxID=2419505 RepID=UPI0006612C37|nr:heavy-metal-associated domain-containing protein [Kocuria sp. HSID16901]MCT1366939.1 heavy-metal-associated domain-containing protein [Rothia sp. p3-SID1597]RUQ20056.1 copper chaperone [Kocuria sp. HSID16901]